MRPFKKVEWSVFDLGCLKWSASAIGIILGAYFSDFVKQYIWILAAIAILTTLRVSYFYYYKSEKESK